MTEPALDDADREDELPGMHEQALLAPTPAEEFRNRWQDLQTGFVDDPEQSVLGAHALATEVIDQVVETLVHERDRIREACNVDRNASTEELRVALKRYHAFVERLLST